MRAVLIALLMLGCRAPPQVTPTDAAPVTSPAPLTDDELCRADGFDFAWVDPRAAEQGFVDCGRGPGTPCDRARLQRCDGRNVLQCYRGRLVALDCRGWCRSAGIPPREPHDDGTCVEREGSPTCECCDLGEPGCTATPNPWRGAPVPLSPPLPKPSSQPAPASARHQ